MARAGSAPPSRASRASGRQALGGVELGPGGARLVRQAAAAGRPAVLAPEASAASAWCSAASARPRSASVVGARPPDARSTRARGTAGRRRRRRTPPAPRARARRPARASQRSPAASVVKNPAGGVGWVLANTRRPSSSSKRNAWRDVAAAHRPRRDAPRCRAPHRRLRRPSIGRRAGAGVRSAEASEEVGLGHRRRAARRVRASSLATSCSSAFTGVGTPCSRPSSTISPLRRSVSTPPGAAGEALPGGAAAAALGRRSAASR